MAVSRRGFLQVAGAGAVGSLFIPWASARGMESLVGKRDVRVDTRPGAPGVIRLNSNENPNGPGAVSLAAITGALGEANRYPRVSITGLRSAIAESFHIDDDSVVLGCGSSDILRACVYAFVTADRPLVTSRPSYESPPEDARRLGARVIEVPVTADLKLDLDAMATAARGVGLVYLSNPNNPTSTVHGAVAIREFVARIHAESPETTVLVDEAYHEYVDDPTYATALPLALDNPRVVIARTFSKVYGLAGMRVGFGLGNARTMGTIAPHTLSMSVNHLAAAAATAGLADRAHTEQERTLNRAARAFTLRALAAAGYPAADSQANFLMVNLRRNAQPFRDACRSASVLVGRPFPPLDTHVRISIGTLDEMHRGMDVFRQVLAAT